VCDELCAGQVIEDRTADGINAKCVKLCEDLFISLTFHTFLSIKRWLG